MGAEFATHATRASSTAFRLRGDSAARTAVGTVWARTRADGAAVASADLTELDLPNTMKMNHPNAEDLLNFDLTITPDEGAFLPSREVLAAGQSKAPSLSWRGSGKRS